MTSHFWQKRPNNKTVKVLWVLTFIIMVLIVAFIYRRPFAIKTIEHLAQEQGALVTCIDFSFDWRLNIIIDQACISSPAVSLELHEAVWQPWSNQLAVTQLTLTHLKHAATTSQGSEKATHEKLTRHVALPRYLPTLKIAHLEVNSYALRQPLHLSIHQTSNNEFKITGDVNARLQNTSDKWIGQVQWKVGDLVTWIPQAQQFIQDNAELLKEAALHQAKIKTNLTLDDSQLDIANSLDIATRIHLEQCPINIKLNGNILIDVNLNSLNTQLDLSQLKNSLSLDDCLLVHDYFAANDVPTLSLIVPQKIAIKNAQVSLPKIQITDKQNSHRTLTLDKLQYQTKGELRVQYDLSIKQAIQTKLIQQGAVDLHAQGTITGNLLTHAPNQAIQLKVSGDDNRLILNDLKIDALFVDKLTSKFSIHTTDLNHLVMAGNIISTEMRMGDTHVAKMTNDFSFTAVGPEHIQLAIDNQLHKLTTHNASTQTVANHIDLKISEGDAVAFSGETSITPLLAQISAKHIQLPPIRITHTGQASLASMNLNSQHNLNLEQGFEMTINSDIKQRQATALLQIQAQDLTALQSIISQFENTLSIQKGELSANIKLTLPQPNKAFSAKGNIDIQQVSGKYQDYLLNNMTYQAPLTFNSAGLQLTDSTLHIDSIDVGLPIKQIKAQVIAKNSVFQLKHLQGSLLNGQFSLADLWLDGREQTFNLNFKHIDLAKLVALQKQPGIQITGNIDGEMPVFMNNQGIRIDNGWMSSLTGGKLTIVDNPSFDSIKTQQPELALLENLDFSKLESNVKFTPDGWIMLDFSLQGNNPDKKQEVNFNYSHQENIFSLLESIRLVKSVENKIEQKITQGDKK